MKRKIIVHLVYITVFISFLMSTFVIYRVNADGQAGVGVINVPPNYADIQIVERNGFIRIYLTVSDYNSWGDIYMVEINLEDNDRSIASFIFKQYETADSFEKIHISYYDDSNDDLKYAVGIPGNWDIESIDNLDTIIGMIDNSPCGSSHA